MPGSPGVSEAEPPLPVGWENGLADVRLTEAGGQIFIPSFGSSMILFQFSFQMLSFTFSKNVVSITYLE